MIEEENPEPCGTTEILYVINTYPDAQRRGESKAVHLTYVYKRT